MGADQLETFEFDVGEYHCKARALSISEWESLQEGALPFLTAQAKEDVILECLLEPVGLKETIASGFIDAGIPLLIFDEIIYHSGYGVSPEERDIMMADARAAIDTSVIESCKMLILASGILNLAQLQDLSFAGLLRHVAIAENVLNIQQQNLLAAMGGGQPIELTWEPNQPQGVQDIMKKHEEKVAEVADLLQQQMGNPRYGLGARPIG